MRGKGWLICIEGLDKSGKTTHSRLLVEALKRIGFDAIYTTEPSDGEIGKFIRRFVLHKRERMPIPVEALLFAADRADHAERVIRPTLNEGRIVVSDRYVYSSLAYQGAAGLDLNWIMEINRMAPEPDLAIYLDVPVEVVMERIRKERRRSVMESLEVQAKVREIYMELVRRGLLIPIDANRPIGAVSKDIWSVVAERLRIRGWSAPTSP